MSGPKYILKCRSILHVICSALKGFPLQINVAEPWFTLIKSSQKTVEGRLCRGIFSGLQVGNLLSISRSNTQLPASACMEACTEACTVEVEVTRVTRYASFEQYLTKEGLEHTLPGVQAIADGVAVYRQFYSAELELEHGVVAIHIQLLQQL